MFIILEITVPAIAILYFFSKLFLTLVRLRNRILPRPIYIFGNVFCYFFDLGEENGSKQLKFNFGFFFGLGSKFQKFQTNAENSLS